MAILQAVAQDLGIKLDLTVLSMRESYTDPIATGVAEFEIDTRSLLAPRAYRQTIKNLDCIVDIGAGDSFADIYGAKRFAFLWLSKVLAYSADVPVILAPQTIGPFEKQPYKLLATAALNNASAVLARDEKSLSAARKLAPTSNTSLSIDVAFRLPFERPRDKSQVSVTKIGINASGLLCKQAETGENRFGLSYDYLTLQRRLIEYWSGQQNTEVYLISHANSAGDSSDDDGARADQLTKDFPNCHRVPDFEGPSEAKSFIAGLDFLVAGRMHACIAAYSTGVPVVPVAYSRKFEGLFGLLDYPAVAPMQRVTADDVFEFIIENFEQRNHLKRRISEGMKKIDDLIAAYEDVLRAHFKAILSR